MSNRSALAFAGAAWLAANAASAETETASPPPVQTTVTVQAQPASKVTQRQTLNFVRSYAAAPNPNVDQIGRWRDPVCVMVLGLPLPEQADKIKARIEGMAQTVGLPPARVDCRPNVEIAFEDDPQKSMDGVAKRLEPLLGYYHLSRTKQLKTVTHPIQAWYATVARSEGVNLAGLIASGFPVWYFQGDVDDPENPTPPGCVSRFSSCYKVGFKNVLIVADKKALTGDRLSLVADDMIMLALSEPKSLDGCNALPSVIDRFAGSPCPGRAPPEGLTAADSAYLTALYSADLEAKKGAEQWDIAADMAKILLAAKADAAESTGPPPSSPAAAKAP